MSAALAFGQALAGNVVALMYAGGRVETFAEGRARRERQRSWVVLLSAPCAIAPVASTRCPSRRSVRGIDYLSGKARLYRWTVMLQTEWPYLNFGADW